MKKLLFVLSLSLSACGLLNDNVKVIADSARSEIYDRGDLKDSMTYHKKVSLEIDPSNRCILVESVKYPDVVYRISDLQYDADMSDYLRKNTPCKEVDGYLFYVFNVKFEDRPSADAKIVFLVYRRPSNKQLLIGSSLGFGGSSACTRGISVSNGFHSASTGLSLTAGMVSHVHRERSTDTSSRPNSVRFFGGRWMISSAFASQISLAVTVSFPVST